MVDNANVRKLAAAYKAWHESKGHSAQQWLDFFDERIDFRSIAQGAQALEFATTNGSRAEAADYLSALVRD